MVASRRRGGVLTPLERGQLGVMRLRAAIFALVLCTAAATADTALAFRMEDWPRGAVLAPVVALGAYLVLIAPGRRYRAWAYALAAEELRIAFGVWTRVQTHVPLARVQHIDVVQGPVERAFGVCRLVLHTAGTMNSRVVLPGLARATAEAIRDEVRARIARDVEA